MPREQLNIAIPGSYDVREPGGKITTYSNGIGSQFISDRPGRERSRRPPGWLYPTSYDIDVSTRRKPLGTLRWNTGHIFTGTIPYVDGNYDQMNALPVSSTAESQAITKALLQLKNQSVNLGVALGEMQQTADLVGTTASRIATAYSRVRRGNIRGALEALGRRAVRAGRGGNTVLPRGWLEMQYAWKPLLSDVYGSYKELTGQEPESFRQTVKGAWRATDSGDYNYISSFGSKRIRYSRESGVQVRLDYVPGNTFFSTLSRVGMTNPLEVAWELVPLSFVVDWFLPIGDFLSTLDATLGWTFLSGSCSTLQRVTGRETPGPSSGYYTSGEFEGRYKRVRLNRKVYLSSPLPAFPGFKNPVSVGHVANGLSLLAAAFGRKR